MKKAYIFFLGVLVLLGVSSCDNVEEGNRFVEVIPNETNKVARAVLIEEFTGQRCVNCPAAHEEMERLQHLYGADSVVAVSIHAGPLAVFPRANVIGLRTELGDNYYKYWKVEAAPMGIVNRTGGVTDRFTWAGQVHAALQKTAALKLSLENVYDDVKREVAIKVTAEGLEDVKGKLQLWIVEDGIICTQFMADGKPKPDYEQNHVLRAAVNGEWGTDFLVNADKTITQSFTMAIDKGWNAEKVSVVAFVYNDGGVQQVTKKHIK